MNVILTKDVKNIGSAGDLVKVAVGFARNFLIPSGSAKEATAAEMKKAEEIRKNRIVRHAEIVKNADKIAEKLTANKIVISRKVSSGIKLFGGVSELDIAVALQEQTKVELEKSHIHLSKGHLKTIGDHTVDVHLYEGKHAKITVEIIPA